MSTEALVAEKREATLESIAFDWWRGLQERRGDRAVMRRCGTVAEVAFAAPYHRLLGRLRDGGIRVGRPEWLAAVAGALAQVDERAPGRSLGEALGTPQGSKPPMSGLRFRRLLRVDEPDELLLALTRAIRMLDRKAPVHALVRDAYWWSDDAKKRWAFDYYEAAPATEA